MAFDPLWNATSDALAPARSGDMRATIRAIATDLISDLARGQAASGDWKDLDLGYVLVDTALSQCLMRLADTGCWGRDNQGPSGELWKVAGSLLQLGWLQLRAREKPLGYAGDYEMLARIVNDQCCDDPVGRHFDRFFLNQSAPQAVRSRTEQIAASLVQHALGSTSAPYHVVSVGCGPGMDVARCMAVLPADRRKDIRVRLLDLDEAGLNYAAGQIGEWLDAASIKTQRENLFRLARRANAADLLGRPDFLLCSGLFDYLEDEVARGILELFWQSLAPGGRMVIGNFIPSHPARAYMEWIGNWYLIYRTDDQFAALADSANIPNNCWSLGTDRTGTDLFLIANKE